jgi:hypothetical protein
MKKKIIYNLTEDDKNPSLAFSNSSFFIIINMDIQTSLRAS